MKRLLTVCGFVLLCGSWAACSPPFAIFEDVGTDPHPPSVELIGIAYQPVAPEEGPAPPPDLQPAEGFVVRPFKGGEDTLLFRVRYTDVGGDVQHFKIRDRDGTLDEEVTPKAPEVEGGSGTGQNPEFFAGTTATVDLPDVGFGATLIGPHRMELWAVDSHGSRSEKVAFTIQVEF